MAILKRSKKSILGLDVQLGNIETNISNNASNISAEITRAQSAEGTLTTNLGATTAAVTILNADNTTIGSVDKKILDSVTPLAATANTYTKTEVDTIAALKIDTALALTTVSAGNKVATQTELNLKANTADVYTQTELDTALSAKANQATTYTKTESDTNLAAKANQDTTYTKTETDALVSPKANSADVYTKTESDTNLLAKLNTSDTVSTVNAGNKVVTQTELTTKANTADVYTKTEIDTSLSTVLVDGDSVSPVTVGNKIATETELSTKANTADVYTKTQLDTALAGKAASSVAGKVGASLKIVDETNIDDGKVIAYNSTSGNLEYVDQIDTGAVINDSASNLTETYSSSKIDTVLATKANAADVYTKTEIDTLNSAASQGLTYTVADITALNAITGMSQDEQALVDADRFVYKYDTTNGWEQFYAMDATHNHNDLYYTETEVDTALAGKANVGVSYTKAESDTALATKAPAVSAGKVGPTLITVDETNIADGKILSYNNATSQLEYVAQDGSNIIDDVTSATTTTYSSSKLDTDLAAKADLATTYSKTEVDNADALKVNVSDVKTAISVGNKVVTETETALKADIATTYTKSEVDTFVNAKVNTSDVLTAITGVNKVVTEADIVGLADSSSVYTKGETDALIAPKANTADVYTQSEIDTSLTGKLNTSDSVTAVNAGNKIVTENELSVKADQATTYTKVETDALVDPKFDDTDAVTAVSAGNKIATETELALKVNVTDVKSTITAGNKVVTESDVAASIAASEAAAATAAVIVVDRPTMSTKSSSGLDYVFEFALSKTPHGLVAVNDEITIYDFHENGDASIFENVSLFADKHAEIAVTLGDVSEATNYTGKTVKVCYLTTETTVTPGTDAQNPIIINAGIDFELQGSGTSTYALDYSAGSFYRVTFTDGYYTNINYDLSQTDFHVTNSTNYQAFHFKPDTSLKSQAWVGQTDEVQYITYNWTMSFVLVSGSTYNLGFTRNAEVGGGGL